MAAGSPALAPGDPHLAILGRLLVLSTPFMITLVVSVHGRAAPEARPFSLAAIVFMALGASLTCEVHFVQLVVLRRLPPEALAAIAPFATIPWRWPSIAFGLDLLAWDVFVGLSLLSAAQVVRGDGLATATRRTMTLAGALCLIGTLGPATGDLRLQLVAIVGYAGLFPASCVLLARWFARPAL